MLSVLQLTFALAVSFILALLSVLIPFGILGWGASAILGIERWHRYGQPWDLNIGLTILWCLLWPSFVFACMGQMPVEDIRSFIDSLYPS